MEQRPQGTGGLPASQVRRPRKTQSTKNNPNIPALSIASREHPFLNMLQDPRRAPSALPPVVLPARAVADRIYQEVLLSTDANGNAAVFIRAHPASMIGTPTTITGTTTSGTTFSDASQLTSFQANFQSFIPLVVDVEARYTGSTQSTSGRFYGQVGIPSNSTSVNVANFPQEDFGCEMLASEGASCTWYSTSPVWNNPQSTTLNTEPTEWGDTTIGLAIVGGPASVTNLVSVGVYFHFAAFPKAGIVGLVPSAITADGNAALVAGLMAAATDGPTAAAMSEKSRAAYRRKKLRLNDVIKIGGKTLGTIAPYMGQAAEVATILSALMV